MTAIPPAVLSMLSVPLLLAAVRPAIADKVVGLFDAAVAPWTTDLLGLFYVPAVAILPVLLRGMQGKTAVRCAVACCACCVMLCALCRAVLYHADLAVLLASDHVLRLTLGPPTQNNPKFVLHSCCGRTAGFAEGHARRMLCTLWRAVLRCAVLCGRHGAIGA